MEGKSPTPKQEDLVSALLRQLHLPRRMLDGHCLRRFGAPYALLDRAQVSGLIDEMLGWKDLPVELARAKGQRDLF